MSAPHPAVVAAPGAGPRRVRHQARDAVALMAFSATASVTLAATFLLLITAFGH